MRAGSFVALVLVTGAVVTAAFYAVVDRKAAVEPETGQTKPMFPGLLDRVNDVDKVTVASAENTVTAERRETADGTEAWVIANKGGYPADADEVKAAVVGVANLRALERRTTRPDLFHRLGVRDLSEDGSEAIRIDLFDADGTVMAAVLRGKIDTYPTGLRPGIMYARAVGNPQSWLVEGRLSVQADPTDWLLRDMPKLARQRVMTATIDHADGERITVRRDTPETSDFTLDALPDGETAKRFDVNNVAGSVDLLSLQDVAPADAFDFAAATTTTVHSFDGLVVTARTIRVDDTPWTTFTAAFDADQAARAPIDENEPTAETASTADTEAGADAEPAPVTAEEKRAALAEAVQAEAKTINQRHAGWAYRLSDYAAGNLTKRRADLIEAPAEDDDDVGPIGPG